MVILNPAPAQKLPEEILQDVDILTPNESEAEILCGLPVRNMQEAEKAAEKLLKMGPEAVIITLGNLGVYLKSYDLDMKISAFQVDVVDTTGAGDAYNGALACALAEGKGLREAAIFANAAGAQCTTKIGTAISMPFRDEIKDLLNN